MSIAGATFTFYRGLFTRLGLKQFDGILSIVAGSFGNDGEQPGGEKRISFRCHFR